MSDDIVFLPKKGFVERHTTLATDEIYDYLAEDIMLKIKDYKWLFMVALAAEDWKLIEKILFPPADKTHIRKIVLSSFKNILRRASILAEDEYLTIEDLKMLFGKSRPFIKKHVLPYVKYYIREGNYLVEVSNGKKGQTKKATCGKRVVIPAREIRRFLYNKAQE